MKKLLLSLFCVGLSVTSALANPITPDTITFNWKGPQFFRDAELLFETPFLSSQLVDIGDTGRLKAAFGSLPKTTMSVDLKLNDVWTTVYTTNTFAQIIQDIPTSIAYTPAWVEGIRFSSDADHSLTGFGGFDSSLSFTFNKAIPTPEPSATLLLGIGLLSLGGYRHWRQKRHQTM